MSDDELYDGWMDRQFEKLQMAYCVTCKCFVDPFENPGLDSNGKHIIEGHEGHILAHTSGEKTSEEVIARLSE